MPRPRPRSKLQRTRLNRYQVFVGGVPAHVKTYHDGLLGCMRKDLQRLGSTVPSFQLAYTETRLDAA